MEANQNLSMILTGSHHLTVDDLWRPLFERSVFREISFLQRADCEELLTRPLAGMAVYEAEALESILRMTSGHPFFTQLIGQSVVDVLNEVESVRITGASLREAVRRIVESPPPQLLYEWSGLPIQEQLVLAALAATLRSPRAYASSDRVAAVLKSIPERFQEKVGGLDARVVLESLRQKNLLDRDQTRYRYRMDLFRLWLKAEHSVWSVLSQESPS